MKNPTILSLTLARSLQMSTLCDLYLQKEFESTMKEFVEKYRMLRQRTVREETNKEKARALPPAVYTKKEESIKVDLLAGLGNDFNS